MHTISQSCPSEGMCLTLSLSPIWHEAIVLSQFVSFGVASPKEMAMEALGEWVEHADI